MSTYSQHVNRYATRHRGRYDRKPYLSGVTFRDDARDLSRRVTIPSPEHVAQHLLAPALASLPADARHGEALDLLANLSDLHWKGNPPREYVGLWTALNLCPAPGVGFDLPAYSAALLTALDAVCDRDTRAAEAAAEKAARAAARAAARPAAKTQTERTATYRAALRDRKLAYVRHALAELTADLDSGAPITRDEVADAVASTLAEALQLHQENLDENDRETVAHTASRMTYRRNLDAWHDSRMLQHTTPRPTPPSPPTLLTWAEVAADEGLPKAAPPPSISRREVITLARELAAELDLSERRHGNGHRFIYSPTPTFAETPDMHQLDHLDALTAAAHAAADAFERLAAAQDAAYASGDRLDALQLQRERLSVAPSGDLPENVTPLRTRRAA